MVIVTSGGLATTTNGDHHGAYIHDYDLRDS
jgi:hypothetical protein